MAEDQEDLPVSTTLNTLDPICRSVAFAFGIPSIEFRFHNRVCRWTAQGGLRMDVMPALPVQGSLALRCPIRKRSGVAYGELAIISDVLRAWSEKDGEELQNFAVLFSDALRSDRAFAFARSLIEKGRRTRKVLRSQAQELWRRQALFAQTERMAKVGGWETDLTTNEMTWSDEIYRISGIPVGKTVSVERALSFYPPEARKRLSGAIIQTMREHAPFDLELPYRNAAGEERWVRSMGQVEVVDGAAARVFGAFQDVTEQKQHESQVRHAAYHDALTGLPNRKFFHERLDQALADAQRAGSCVALLLLDLDGFKSINDTHGHDAGDAVLRIQSARLRAAVRDNDFVARLGGDEFAVILPSIASPNDTLVPAERILTRLREPIAWQELRLECKGSVGIATFPHHDVNQTGLYKSADLALYKAKGDGRNQSVLFAPALRLARERRDDTLAVARTALDENWIVPFYQPVIELASGRVSGFEALLRWRHPSEGLKLPGTIAPAFDDFELGCALGDRMRSWVLADMHRWRTEGVAFGRIGLNVSEPEFRRGELAQRILRDLSTLRIPTRELVLEVTENALMSRNADQARTALERLRASGVHVALDDFGTGASSLVHLQQFPVSAIKIDRSFVKGVCEDSRSRAIVSAMVALSRELDFDLVAEGVEDSEQLDFLRQIGCRRVQGFLLGRPMPAQEVPGFLGNWAYDHQVRQGSLASIIPECSADPNTQASTTRCEPRTAKERVRLAS